MRPNSPPPPAPDELDEVELEEAVGRVEDFRDRCISDHGQGLLLVTGAGVSVDSGIPDYRGHKGSYYENHRPITHDEYCTDATSLKRYWARSLVGYDRFARARPNACHRAMAKLEASGMLTGCITQNVDDLHQSAGMENVVNLHGCGHDVLCLNCGSRGKR